MIAAFWLASAWSAEDCLTPLTERELRTLVRQSAFAIDNDDPVGHKRSLAAVLEAIPCLDHQLPKDAWAELLVNEAIVRKVTLDPDWDRPLATALDLIPEFDKVPTYLVADFVPLPPTRFRAEALPPQGLLFVDGVLQTAVPVIEGLHVAQLYMGGAWQSRVLDSEPIPDVWLDPVEATAVESAPSDEAKPRGTTGIVAGIGFSRQLVEESGDFLPSGRVYAGLAGFATTGVHPIALEGGVYWDALLPFALLSLRTQDAAEGTVVDTTSSLVPVVAAGPAWVRRQWHVGIGGGVIQVRRIQGEAILEAWFPQPQVHVGAWSGRARFAVAGGATPGAGHALTRASWQLGEVSGPTSWRLGIDAQAALARFVEAPPGDREASVLQIQALARLDFAWGYRPRQLPL